MDIGGIVYPLLLLCALVGVMLLVGIGFSYFWLVAMDAQGRTCPNCHKRGAGNLIASDTLDSTSHTTWSKTRGYGRASTGKPRLLEVTEENYEDHYECRHCGHKWTKTGKETTRTPVTSQDKVTG